MRATWWCIDCQAVGEESADVAANDKAAERHVKTTGHTTLTHISA